jgi:hypothetical protein
MKPMSLVLVLAVVYGCSTTEKDTPKPQKKVSQSRQKLPTLQAFDTIPEELMGAGCWFSRTRKDYRNGESIFASSYGEDGMAACVKINGKLEMLKSPPIYGDSGSSERVVEIYTNSKWTVVVRVASSEPSTDYNTTYKGTLNVARKGSPDTLVVPFIGDCGC